MPGKDGSGGYQDAAFVADYYDSVAAHLSRTDVAFYVGHATDCGGPVLELACGTGRVLLPTARAGIDITGVDLAEPMLARCRGLLEEEPPEVQARVRLLHASICELSLPERFSLVTLPFRPFQHLTDVADQLACLDVAFRHLRPGGRLVLDVFDPDLARLGGEAWREEIVSEPFAMPDGRQVIRHHKVHELDRVRQVLDMQIAYEVTWPDGRRTESVHRFDIRYFFRWELEHLLARAGFRVVAMHGSFAGEPVGAAGCRDLIAVAQRPE